MVDVGDGIAAAFRIESHNHPSAIEPYEGAATGVGGILRDVFSVGARPIALMDPLRFGPLDDPRSRWIAEGVVSGVSGYGNSVGVPTVGGETVFDPTYQDNPLVNVFCLGRAPHRAPRAGPGVRGRATSPCCSARPPGRDGIGGASVLASAGFGEDGDDDKRPERAGRRPVRGEAADRGLPRDPRRRARGRDPGPRRRRHHRRRQRDVVEGRRRDGRVPRPRCTSARRAWSPSRS